MYMLSVVIVRKLCFSRTLRIEKCQSIGGLGRNAKKFYGPRLQTLANMGGALLQKFVIVFFDKSRGTIF